jgi:hypothetical protein
MLNRGGLDPASAHPDGCSMGGEAFFGGKAFHNIADGIQSLAFDDLDG